MNEQEQLLYEISEDFPRHIYLLGKDMNEKDFVDVLFQENLGQLIQRLKTMTNRNPGLESVWNRFFENTTKALSDWYTERRVKIEDPKKVARLVLTELTVHNEKYNQNKNAFEDLILDQKIIDHNPKN